jgi:hypothetical protein
VEVEDVLDHTASPLAKQGQKARRGHSTGVVSGNEHLEEGRGGYQGPVENNRTENHGHEVS